MERKWWTLIAVNVATFMLLLDITVVNTALPAIQDDLDASFTDLQWVVDAYSLALAARRSDRGLPRGPAGAQADVHRRARDLHGRVVPLRASRAHRPFSTSRAPSRAWAGRRCGAFRWR